MALNPNAFVDGVMSGFSIHIEPPSYMYAYMSYYIELYCSSFFHFFHILYSLFLFIYTIFIEGDTFSFES